MAETNINNKGTPFCPNCETSSSVNLKFTNKGFNVFLCLKCNNGFTYPIPNNISKYYHIYYWVSPGLLGELKKTIFKLFQTRRKRWIYKFLSGGKILEIGAGEGDLKRTLNKKFSVTCIDSPNATLKNKDVLKVDFLKWKTKIKYDGILFWESLEHVSTPQKYLEKAAKLLNKNGLIFIEYPKFNSIESQLLGKYWFHLDLPRHLAHFSDNGLNILLKRSGLRPIFESGAVAFEYSIFGLSQSLLNFLGIQSTDYLKRSGNIFILFLLLPIIFFSSFFEIIFLLTNQSPIRFLLAKK